MNLFEDALEERLRSRGPLANRLRPKSLDDVLGQDHLLGPRGALRALVDARRLTSVILWGPAGTGKTTIARLLADAVGAAFESVSAVSAGVKDVREAAERARRRLAEHGTSTVLLLDEVHRFSKSQQDALLPSVEDGTLTLVGATTENPFFEVNGPLLSRSTLFRLEPLDRQALRTLLDRGLETEGGTIEDQAAEAIVDAVDGDGRALLTTLEVALAVAGEGRRVTLDDVERARNHPGADLGPRRPLRRDQRLHQEHPRWRRRCRPALVGPHDRRRGGPPLHRPAPGRPGQRGHRMAEPTSLLVATAAANAVEYVGLPEAQLNLAQAVVHLATAPKSNRSALGIWKALEDVRSRPAGPVPTHLRDAHYRSAERIGHGVGYQIPPRRPPRLGRAGLPT